MFELQTAWNLKKRRWLEDGGREQGEQVPRIHISNKCPPQHLRVRKLFPTMDWSTSYFCKRLLRRAGFRPPFLRCLVLIANNTEGSLCFDEISWEGWGWVGAG